MPTTHDTNHLLLNLQFTMHSENFNFVYAYFIPQKYTTSANLLSVYKNYAYSFVTLKVFYK